jgi:hypothetical protein
LQIVVPSHYMDTRISSCLYTIPPDLHNRGVGRNEGQQPAQHKT